MRGLAQNVFDLFAFTRAEDALRTKPEVLQAMTGETVITRAQFASEFLGITQPPGSQASSKGAKQFRKALDKLFLDLFGVDASKLGIQGGPMGYEGTFELVKR